MGNGRVLIRRSSITVSLSATVQALHARTLGFVHPVTGEQMDFTSELPNDLSTLIEKWRSYVGGLASKQVDE